MPFNGETGLFYQSPTTVVDSTPDGDSVKNGFNDRMSPALKEVYQDMNTLRAVGSVGVPDGMTILPVGGALFAPGMFPGCVNMFSGKFGGSDGKRPIPTGSTKANEYWALCDGTNGTPDLRDHMIMSAGTKYPAGSKGGAENHEHKITGTTAATTLSVAQMPRHVHGILLSTSGSNGYNGVYGLSNAGSTQNNSQMVNSGGSGSHLHTMDVSSEEVSNLPPYYALSLIMRIP